ncbi:hypothetical protein DB333_11260, partial [Levilactobacillus brevis]
SLSIGFRRLDCSTGQYALFSLFYKKGVDGFYPSTPNIIEPKKRLTSLSDQSTVSQQPPPRVFLRLVIFILYTCSIPMPPVQLAVYE